VAGLPSHFADRYRLIAPLGSGNFGEVWQCHDEHQDEIVAVKIFGQGVRLDDVLTEARLQARLVLHPHVVTVRNVITEPPLPLVAMDFLAGGSVGARLANAEVPIKEAIAWMRDALAGLGHAHAMGVLHRDVKPGNILLDAGGRAQLSDFGIAEDTLVTHRGTAIAYLRHRAPELVGGGQASAQTDVWAAGCTLYRLLTGSFPFANDTDVCKGSCQAPHKINLQVPLMLSRVTMKALAVAPGDRFADAREMLTALAACPIVNSWTQTVNGADEGWSCATGTVCYEVAIRRVGASYKVEARRNLGSGFRLVRKATKPTLNQAQQLIRKWLVLVVEDGKLGPL
jgi:eukaryotic-like serine/threonine-protein kinase